MDNIDNNKLLKRGKLELHTRVEATQNSKFTKHSAAELTQRVNTFEHLKTNLIDTGFIRRDVSRAGALVQTIYPTSPYGYGGVMVIAADSEDLKKSPDASDEVVKTKNIYDLDQDAQRLYFQQIIASMIAMKSIALPGEEKKAYGDYPAVIATENTTADVSNRQHRIGRTIALPHVHVFKSNQWTNENAEIPMPFHIRAERRLLSRPDMFKEFSTFITQEMPNVSLTPEHFKLSYRNSPPVGYTITTQLSSSTPLPKLTDQLTAIMRFNHSSLARWVRSKIDETNTIRATIEEPAGAQASPTRPSVEDTIIPQPSYRTYIYFDENDKLSITISPVVFSTTAALEASDVFVHRSPQYTSPFTPEQMASYKELFEKRVNEILQ